MPEQYDRPVAGRPETNLCLSGWQLEKKGKNGSKQRINLEIHRNMICVDLLLITIVFKSQFNH